MQNRDRLRQIVTLIAIPFGIALNFIPFNGQSVGAVAGAERTAVDAAGYAFAIWGVIFAWQLVYAVYQALPAQRENPILRRVAPWAVANALGGGLWAVVVQYKQLVLANAIIVLLLLLPLVAIEAGFRRPFPAPGGRDLWLVRVPFSINLGWVSVATIISNAGFLRRTVGWEGAPLSEPGWAAVMIVVAAALGIAMLLLRRNVPFALVIVWALIAVAVQQAQLPVVPLTALALAFGVVLALVAVVVTRRRQQHLPGQAT